VSATAQPPLISYPTVYVFKVMGRPDDDFEGFVRALFSTQLGFTLGPGALSRQASSRGTYVSLTVSVTLTSEDHRRAVYQRLSNEPRIVYFL
jgi:putative lipoic acid-binding regulatory protein